MGKRIMLFLLTNMMVLLTIVIVFSILSLFGVNLGAYNYGAGTLNLVPLLIISAVIGFAGAFISLAMSRFIAKKAMNVKVIDPDNPGSQAEKMVVEKVHRLCRRAGLTHMPEVGIYQSAEVNAFATGPTKKRSLVSVSTGLLQSMDDDAVEGVIAHEVAHVANGDMITMTLLQGIVNTFVVFLARVVAFAVSRFVNENMRPIIHFLAIIVFQILFSILGSIVVAAYSRYREYHADRGGADLAGRDKMAHALRSLQNYVDRVDTEQSSMQTLKINNKPSAAAMLFSSHPPLEDRIRRLEQS